MTTINAFASDTSVDIFSDGGIWDATGQILAIGPKVLPLPQYCGAIGATGPANVTFLLFWELAGRNFGDFDALVSGAKDFVSEVIARHGAVMGIGDYANFDVLLAGWSDRFGRMSLYNLRVRGRTIRMGVGEALAWYQSCATPKQRAWKIRPDHIETDGLALFEDQRNTIYEIDAGAGPVRGTFTAGFCQYTRCSRDGVHTKILATYPDQIGQETGEPVATSEGFPAVQHEPSRAGGSLF